MRVETFAIGSMDDRELTELSRRRLLALSLEEMQTLRREWSRPETRAVLEDVMKQLKERKKKPN